jgi:hypothetical protein
MPLAARRTQEDPDMPQAGKNRDRTLQDDRVALDSDPETESPLVKGEAAPLAEDGVITAEPDPKTEMTTPAFLGGAPVPVITRADTPRGVDPTHDLTAAEDEPIND